MENFTSNINKPGLQNYNTDNINSMEEECVPNFSNINYDKYVNLNNINESLNDVITEEDIFEDSNNDLSNEKYSDNPDFFQLNINAFQSAHYFSTYFY